MEYQIFSFIFLLDFTELFCIFTEAWCSEKKEGFVAHNVGFEIWLHHLTMLGKLPQLHCLSEEEISTSLSWLLRELTG